MVRFSDGWMVGWLDSFRHASAPLSVQLNAAVVTKNPSVETCIFVQKSYSRIKQSLWLTSTSRINSRISMEKHWNLMMYSTWILLRDLNDFLVTRPVQYDATRLFPQSKNKQLREYNKYMKKMEGSPKTSLNFNFAFRIMLISTGLFVGLIMVGVEHFLNLNPPYGNYIVLIISFSSSIFINYYYLHSDDKNKKYFQVFNQHITKRTAYLIAFMFNLIPIIAWIYLFLNM